MNYLSDLSVSELDDLINMISEDVSNDLTQYDDLDFIDAFVFLFKKWLSENHQEKSTKFPFSYPVKKYGGKFARDILGDKYSVAYPTYRKFQGNYWSIRELMTNVIRFGIHTLPSVKKEKKFTERFQKPLDKFIKNLKLDDSVNLKIIEDSPYDLIIVLVIDFPNYLKTERYIAHPSTIEYKLRDFAEGYLGVEIGEPVTGGLRIRVREQIMNEEEWVKNVLNKQIKKEIKNMMYSKNIQRIVFKKSLTSPSELEIILKSGSPRGPVRGEFKQEVIRYIESLGYKKIRVEMQGY